MHNIFMKKQYLDCPHLKHSLHFFYDEIRACCANAEGPIFYPDYDGSDINLDYIYSLRKKYVKKINSLFSGISIPSCCKNCFEIENSLSSLPIKQFINAIDRLYIQNNMSCNAKCTYCSFADEERGYKYKVLPLVKSIIDKEILSSNASVIMSGGEITITPEFDDLLDLLLSYKNVIVEILTSGIKYSEKIKKGFTTEKLGIVISLDSGCSETYKKVKRVDAFDLVVSNLKEYTSFTDYAKEHITLKYIIVDDINDNILEIKKFLDIVKMLGIKKVRLDVDFVKYTMNNDKKVPTHYFELYDYFNSMATELGLTVLKYSQVEMILKK